MAFGQYMGIIGTVVGGVIGAVLSPYTGGSSIAVGMAIGGALGGIAGQVFFPEKGEINAPPPPQPHETRQQISTYGAAIPIQYGSGRMSGNIVRMSPVVETVERSRHRQDGVRYYEMVKTYAATFAMCFCEGPVPGVARIWVNGKIFADFRDPAGPYYPSGSTALASANLDTSIARSETFFSIHFGTEAQDPDATLVALFGAAAVPAYRGRCYIVFIDFPVGEFSGIPQIEIEIGEVDEIVDGSPGSTVPAEEWDAIGFTEWSESDLAGDMTLSTSEVTITSAGNGAFCLAYRTAAFGTAAQVRGAFTVTALDGANYQDVDILQLQDGSSNAITVKATVNATAVGLYLIDAVGNDVHNYTGVSFPFTRYFKLVFTGADTAELRIYTDSGYTTLEDTLAVINTGMGATPSIAYAGVGGINAYEETNRSPVSITIAAPEVLA